MSFQRLKDHALSQHRDSVSTDYASSTVGFLSDNSSYDNADTTSASYIQTQNWPAQTESKVQESFMRFISAVGSKPGIPQSAVQVVTEELGSLVRDVTDHAIQTVHGLCDQLSVSHTDSRVSAAVGNLSELPQFLGDVDTQHKRKKWLVDNGYLIEPIEVSLGTRTDRRYSSQLRRSRSVIVEDTFQYIPIDKLLGKLLEDPVAVTVFKQHQSCGIAEYPRMRDFCDTDTFRQNSFFKQHPDALMLHLFVDAFETVNVLGSHTTVHKLEGLYCIFRNAPNMYLSKTSSIFLLGLWHSLDVKRYGYDKLFMPLLKQLEDLESEKGLMVMVHGQSVSLHGIVVAFSADNLGAHSLFGYLESFSANHFCRFCLTHKTEIQEKFHEKHFVIRTADDYDCAVKRCRDADYNASSSGIKTGFTLNSLKYFHCTQQSVPDCMHDICEGVGPYELELVLQSLIDKRFVTLDLVNQRIAEFNYSMSDRNSKPPELTLPRFRLQAAEFWCLCRNLPLIIGSSVPRGDPHWQLLIALLDCMSIVFAPEVTANLADFLSYLVEEHHTQFKLLFPDKPLLPKHHFMIHYGAKMKQFGPLICYWCMRFEAKHRFGKEVSSSCRNFMNICKTIAVRSQHRLANDLLNHTLFKPVISAGTPSHVIIQNMDDSIAEAICLHFGLERQDELYILSSCQLGHYCFKPGCYVVMDVVDGIPQFGTVLLILNMLNTVYLISKCSNTNYFDEHYYSYCIEEKSQIVIIPVEKLKVNHPLACHKILADGKEQLFINTRHKLF